jgi:hypothetical protein
LPVVDPTIPVIDPVIPILDPVVPTIPVIDPVLPILDPVVPTIPVIDPVDPIVPTVPVIDPTTPIVDPIPGTVDPVQPPVVQPELPVTDPILDPVDPTVPPVIAPELPVEQPVPPVVQLPRAPQIDGPVVESPTTTDGSLAPLGPARYAPQTGAGQAGSDTLTPAQQPSTLAVWTPVSDDAAARGTAPQRESVPGGSTDRFVPSEPAPSPGQSTGGAASPTAMVAAFSFDLPAGTHAQSDFDSNIPTSIYQSIPVPPG